MFEPIVTLLRFVQAALEPAIAPNAQVFAVLVIAALGAAALAAVVSTSRVIPALVAADASGASTRFRQTADPWRLLAQSDPDAPGRARPRAPGRGHPAA